MGDLYRDTPSVGEPSGAGSELSEWQSALRLGLFTDASRPKPGINLPSEFSNEFQRLDKMNDLKAVPRCLTALFCLMSRRSHTFSAQNDSRRTRSRLPTP